MPKDTKGELLEWIHTIYPFNAEHQAGKLWIPILYAFWFDLTMESKPRLPTSYAGTLNITCTETIYNNPSNLNRKKLADYIK